MGETQGFKVRVGVVLLEEGRLILVRQNDRPFWVFPGGTLEEGEGLETCAVREMKEELNLEVSIERLLYVADFFHPKRQVVDVFFLAKRLGGQLTMALDENLNEVRWVVPDELSGLNVQPRLAAEAVAADWPSAFTGTDSRYLGTYSCT